jgi:hypothetical protein
MMDDDVEWIMNNPVKSHRKMWTTARQYKKDDSYYKIIRECNGTSEINVITTNYTPLCSAITELCEKRFIAYVNGSFRWFEQAKEMRILDVTKADEDFSKKDYFPFIFLQSGVKPIVSSVQIEEWHKAISFLKDAERLVIVGYRANCDDNHLNSIIREYILKGKEVIYLAYDADYKEKTRFFNSFRLEQKKDGQENVRIEHVCKNNAIDIFESYIKGE